MKYLPLLLMFFLFSCQSKQERLFEEFEILASRAARLDARLSDISGNSESFNYVTLKVSNDYHNSVIPAMSLLFDVISKDLSGEEYQTVLELMESLEDIMVTMEKALDTSEQQKTVISAVFSF